MEIERLSGQVKSAHLCLPLEGTFVAGLNSEGKQISSCYCDKNGQWKLNPSTEITKIRFNKKDYVSKEIDCSKKPFSIVILLEEQITGYTDKLWFVPGQKIDFYIHSPDDYTARLYRNGLRTEKVYDFGVKKSFSQQVVDANFVAEGLNWKKSFSFRIPENYRAGLYTLSLQAKQKTDNTYRLTFIISTKPENYAQNTELLVLASSNTWQAYNVWGGRSRYRNFEDPIVNDLKSKIRSLVIKRFPESFKQKLKALLKNQIVVTMHDHPDNWQFRPLSIRRPHPNCSINEHDVFAPFTSHLAAGEWRFLAWLEKENYAYDFVSGFEFHQNPDLLSNYRTIVLNTHCEYWSKKMYQQLKKFYKQGGTILNISGNSLYREVEFDKFGNMQCISLRFSESVEDETKLLGVRFDMKGYQTCSPFKVLKPDHWIFKGTGLRYGDFFSRSSLNKPVANKIDHSTYDPTKPGIKIKNKLKHDGGSGWETDKLSKTAANNISLLAKGMNPRKGGADMIIREPENGSGFLFSASSITFGSSLLVDENSSKIVRNLMARIENL